MEEEQFCARRQPSCSSRVDKDGDAIDHERRGHDESIEENDESKRSRSRSWSNGRSRSKIKKRKRSKSSKKKKSKKSSKKRKKDHHRKRDVKKKDKRRKRKRYYRSDSSDDSSFCSSMDEDCSSVSSSSSSHDNRSKDREDKTKYARSRKSSQEIRRDEEEEIGKDATTKENGQVGNTYQPREDNSAGITSHQKKEDTGNTNQQAIAKRRKMMVPMRKEEYEAQQNIIREVFDPESGRYRLVKGTGEIIERIVSRQDHERINKVATRGDGRAYTKHLRGAF